MDEAVAPFVSMFLQWWEDSEGTTHTVAQGEEGNETRLMPLLFSPFL